MPAAGRQPAARTGDARAGDRASQEDATSWWMTSGKTVPRCARISAGMLLPGRQRG
jgi:hypothetical protein